ncbi:MAG: metallophosphoesterase, partial [Thermoanaerobaculia bacterium]|nr:metallophosphoesterase [Thermoanaerobaculia bacterium]
DYVVASGDLTRRAKPRQFRAARSWLQALDRPVLAVPGNHDVPMYRFWERLLVPYGAWRKHYCKELEPRLGDDEVALVGVNSATNFVISGGKVTPRSRERMVAAFAGVNGDAYRIAVLHHNLFRPPDLEDVPRPPRTSTATLDALARAEVDLVLGGHSHQSFYGRSPVAPAGGRRPALLLYAGTASCSRGRGVEKGQNTCHWLEVDGAGVTVGFWRWSPQAETFVEERRETFPRWEEGRDG